MTSNPVIRLSAALCLLSGAASLHAEPTSLESIDAAIAKGVAFLEKSQAATGAWDDENLAAMTALPVAAIMRNPARAEGTVPASAQKGYAFILSQVKPDGGIYKEKLGTYNTALSLMSLTLHPEAATTHVETVKNARNYLIGLQAKKGTKSETEAPYLGGIGYGGSVPHSDLSNSHLAMEALYYSKQILADTPAGQNLTDLDWAAAIDFVSRCQNLEGEHQMPGNAVTDQNRGGFVYFPGNTKSESDQVGDKVALRSYGSMSYAGLLSFIYADMDPSDPRVVAVKKWLGANYTLKENPFMGAQGLYYYYHTMAKVIALSKIEKLELKDGSQVDWKNELAAKLIGDQNEDGSWTNKEANRWREDNAVLVTSYSLLSLENIRHALTGK